MLMAHVSGKPAVIAGVARIVVTADFLFTATAVVAQPITGVLLARSMGYSLLEGWIVTSIILYIVTGAFWLPVVWMQMRMRDLAAQRKYAASSDISQAFLALVRFRYPGLYGSRDDLLVDDRTAADRFPGGGLISMDGEPLTRPGLRDGL